MPDTEHSNRHHLKKLLTTFCLPRIKPKLGSRALQAPTIQSGAHCPV